MFELALAQESRFLIDLIASLGRTCRIFQQESVFCAGLTFGQFFILQQAAQAGGRINLSDLHPLLEVDKSTTTRLIAPLVKQKLLCRERSPEDSRAVVLSLTQAGREVVGVIHR